LTQHLCMRLGMF